MLKTCFIFAKLKGGLHVLSMGICFLSAPLEQRRLYGSPFKGTDGRKLATEQAQ